jgi:hypothetical protein
MCNLKLFNLPSSNTKLPVNKVENVYSSIAVLVHFFLLIYIGNHKTNRKECIEHEMSLIFFPPQLLFSAFFSVVYIQRFKL